MKAERTGQLYAENNIFEPSSNLNAILNKPADDGCNDTGKYCDSRLGFVKSVGNVANGAKINENEPDKVFNPHSSYSYNADPADANLANRLKTYTGSQTVWVLATGSQQPPPNNPPPQNPPPNNPPPNQPPAGGTGSAGGDTPADGGSVTVTPSGTSTGAPVASVEYKIDGRTVKKTTNGTPSR